MMKNGNGKSSAMSKSIRKAQICAWVFNPSFPYRFFCTFFSSIDSLIRLALELSRESVQSAKLHLHNLMASSPIPHFGDRLEQIIILMTSFALRYMLIIFISSWFSQQKKCYALRKKTKNYQNLANVQNRSAENFAFNLLNRKKRSVVSEEMSWKQIINSDSIELHRPQINESAQKNERDWSINLHNLIHVKWGMPWNSTYFCLNSLHAIY